MKNSREFRNLALEALRGNWKIAVFVGFVATLLGGVDSNSVGFSYNIKVPQQKVLSDYASLFVVCIFVIAILIMIIGSFVGMGYARFNLNLL